MDSLNRLFLIFPCHRRADRCLHFKGEPMKLCSRCLSMYSTILFSLFPLYYLIDVNLLNCLIGFILLIPLVIDGFTQKWKWRTSNNFLRIFTGFLFGIGYNILLVIVVKFLFEFLLNL